MWSLERHRDVGAYALGVLDEAAAFRFEDHLVTCPRCTAQVTEFGPTARQLMLYRKSTPPFVAPLAEPGPRLLERLLREQARRRRAGRRRLLYGLAASVVLAVAGPALTAFAGHPGQGSVTSAATDPGTGVSARVTSEDTGQGSRVELTVRDASGPHTCRLVVVGRDGSEQVVGGWRVGGGEHAATSTMAGTTMRPEEIARYEVRTTDGQRLVAVPGA
ncbi:zf-HC2 domain-containing protein [Streptomyces sp. J2-1]|uniref:zf-HC2 domain-containing protein n=1 Tax=Streptomyces corallincola TaxID=2851888 RepID=UPI001C380354|nr:zf-HC2 domain-containing protein [Streptomyces corallincola]MBV2356289.1 zf-HC2 domain-containing protein [Streptomyces corallincola]